MLAIVAVPHKIRTGRSNRFFMTSTAHHQTHVSNRLFLGLFALAARNVIDPDLWWHLRTGEFIAQHRSVPHTDPFPALAPISWSLTNGSPKLECTNSIHAGFAPLILLFAAITRDCVFLL